MLNITETCDQLLGILEEKIKMLSTDAHGVSIILHPSEDGLLAWIADICRTLVPGAKIDRCMDISAIAPASLQNEAVVGGRTGRSEMGIVLLSPDTSIWNDIEGQSNIETYLKINQKLHNRIFLVFVGEHQEDLCYKAVTAIHDILESGQQVYESVIECYCDIQACRKLKYHIAYAKLGSAVRDREHELEELEYWCRLALTGPAHLLWTKRISRPMQTLLCDKIRSQVYTVSGPSFFSNSCVLLFSPHPDDDVIAAGLGLQHMNRPGVNLHVAYCVTGYASVRDSYLGYMPKCPAEACAKKADVRKREAIKALGVLGIAPERVHFLELPFYGDAHHFRRSYDSSDVQIVKDIITRVGPDHIFLAADLSDPHRTHEVCYHIIKDALEALYSDCYQELRKAQTVREMLRESRVHSENQELCIEDVQSAVCGPINLLKCQRIQPLHVVLSIKRALQIVLDTSPPILWLYRGSWNEFDLGEASLVISGDDTAMQRKRAAIQAHCSQMEAAMFMGDDTRSFDVRATERNAEVAEKLRTLGIPSASTIRGAECYLCSLVLL